MDGLREFVDQLQQQAVARGRFRGLLHVLIGRRLTRADGTVVSTGLTWREVARLLKRVRWDKEAVRELGLDPAQLPARDREKYWYAAISQAQVDSPAARAAADELAAALRPLGYEVGPGPRG
jgi:hypothetical protein